MARIKGRGIESIVRVSAKQRVKQLTPFFKRRLVRAIGASEFEAWKIHRGAKLSARSWNIDVETMKQIFRLRSKHAANFNRQSGASAQAEKATEAGNDDSFERTVSGCPG